MDSNAAELADRLQTHVRYLAEETGERNAFRYASLEQARRYIESVFTRAEYQVRHDSYEISGRTYHNVIAELAGSENRVIVIGAHYDTAPGTPGADDNASGVAALLELARSLRRFSPGPAIRWIAFTLEEPPYFGSALMGSRVHARKCRQRGERVAGMLSLEMLGYYCDLPGSQEYPLPFLSWLLPDRGNFIALAGNLRSWRLVRKVAGRMAKAGGIPIEHVALPVPGAGLSDNRSFWEEGYPALMITDTAFFRNPHYHARSDLPETLDDARMAAVVRALEKAIRACWAGPQR
jgi:Zn-dependent M28 family amino/carboxypeptidase